MFAICVVGYGYWGPNLVRNFMACKDVSRVVVCENNPNRIEVIKNSYPNAKLYTDFDMVVADPEIDAVVLATPVATHYKMAKAALLAGKNVLVEKPLTIRHAESMELETIAHTSGKILMVDHTFLYHPSVRYIKKCVENGELGELYYYDSTRINLGLFQNDVNVLWDLAVHDISILNFLSSERPMTISARGQSHTTNGIINIGVLTLTYASGFFAHINCSWVSPVKIRHTLLGGSKKMILYNDLSPMEPIKIYDSGFSADNVDKKQRMKYEYRIGDVFSPRIEQREPLSAMVRDFIDAIRQNGRPISSGSFAADTVKILEAADVSVKKGGAEVALSW